MSNREVVVLSANRSAIGTFGGGLSSLEPAELGADIIKGTVERSGVDPSKFGYVTVGNVIPTESRYPYVARVAAVNAGLPKESTALAVNRLCGSAMQAIVTSAQQIMLGDVDYAIGGGVEVMSRGAYLSTAMRSGARMGDSKMIDSMVAALTDPFGVGHMGITAENLAEKYGITREEQDAFAAESHRRAAAAREAGYFKDQIIPITIKTRKGDVVVDTDEHIRPGTTVEALAKMKPAFKRDGGTVTAGNASGINDGAAFLVLTDADTASKENLTPIARLVSYSVAGLDNAIMGYGPVPATQSALAKAGLTIADMDVIESNEAFAAQALSVAKGLDLPADKTNPNGGAIALGHPVGCSGAFIVTKLLHELKRTGGKYGLATMCIGGGQGIATIYEAL